MSTIKVKVPGSIMLMGEHAVLFGEKALACAVDKYIHIELVPRPDSEIHIDSALAQYQSVLEDIADEPKLSFVIAAVRRYSAKLPSGFLLRIQSEFSHKVGLGSSAAVTAGVVAALSAFTNQSLEPQALFDKALKIVHQVQEGRGSGTDLVASIYGAVVSYRVEPREITSLPALPEISLFYAGYKTKTPDVLKIVEAKAVKQPEVYSEIYKLMGLVTEKAEVALKQKNWLALGELMNNYQGLMDALGVSDRSLCDIIYSLRGSGRILGAKISGSGLGDCVLSLGNDSGLTLPYEQIPVGVSAEGVTIEYN
ncbi:mevalonate kinase [Neptuniibacter caesariensis]|uniref:GHMP kinase n=1 Tax=Neptuniibacter caesariensis TaxID=207954 RepID=A0A7U8C5K6_NEPCE|nr:mevalonate kinase [Neptuniibacter caesariensis]EAR60276.1 GHMP kinase [Oceanospirillum sp. MED92] [Neptuniibacter caesariensis]